MKRVSSLLTMSVLAAILVSPSIVTAEEVLQLPNLVPLAPYAIQFGEVDDPSEGPGPQFTALRFSVSTANIGAYALELHGGFDDDDSSGETVRSAAQCVWWISRVCTHTVPIGEFVWHEEHGHWHLAEYATYELRRLTDQGEPDMSPAGLVAPGQKVSFCLIDSYSNEDAPPGHDPLRSVSIYQFCTGHVQGISPGSHDEYGHWLYGQQIPINREQVSDGVYAIVVTVNPENELLETDPSDNTDFTIIEISEEATEVRAF